MKLTTHILITVFCCCIQDLSGQSFGALISSYDEFKRTTPVENLQIDTDRDLYLAGESIYFSVRGHPDNNFADPGLSDIICVELINAQNEIAGRKRIKAAGLNTTGDINLQKSSVSGYYTIQAYTSWNRNFGQAFIAKKIIRVINGSQSRAITDLNREFLEQPEQHLIIHPVYGKMLVNTSNKLIVQALTKFLQPVSGRGIIYTVSGDTLTSFYTDKTGLGSFELRPLSGERYNLQFITSSGDSLYMILPVAGEGMGINSSFENEILDLEVVKTDGFHSDENLNLIITRGNSIVYNRKEIHRPWEDPLFIPLPSEPGVHTVFLLTGDLEVLAQSNFFVPPRLININVRSDKSNLANREKVQVNIDIPEKATLRSSYSLKVIRDMELLSGNHLSDWMDLFDGSMLPQAEHLNIPVRDQQALVNLMEKYVHTLEPVINLSEIIGIMNSKLEIPPEHKGEILSGSILSRSDNNPVPGQIVVLSFNGESVRMYNTITDTAGKFAFHLSDVEDTHQVTLCCYPPDDSKTISIDSHYSGNTSGRSIPPLRFNESDRKDMEELFMSTQVQLAYQGEGHAEEQKTELLTNSFYGEADFCLVMDRYVELPVMEEVFFELVKKVVVSKSREGSKLLVIDENVPHVIGESPLILVDGVPFMKPGFVLALPPSDVISIRVVHYRYYLENISFDGIIDIRTTRGEIRINDLPPGALSLEYHFKQKASVPHFPVYSSGQDDQKRVPDYRNLFYWDPMITDPDDISFYTSDQKGRYRIIVKEYTDGRVTGLGSGMITVE